MTNVSIRGDDFTPPETLARAVRELDPSGRLELSLHDLSGARFQKDPVDGVEEYLGTPEDMVGFIADSEVLLTTFGPVTADVIDRTDLQLIVCGRGGPVNIDTGAAEASGVTVVNCPGRNVDAVAEYVIGLMMVLARRIIQADRWARDGLWVSGQEDSLEKPTGPELRGKTLGIVGFGAIGRRVATLASAFGMEVLVHDPFVDSDTDPAVAFVPKDELVKRSTFLTVHARPPGDGTAIIGRAEISAMPESSFLINTSRGVNVDEDALLDGLESGPLAGAAVDVLTEEPIDPDHPLLGRDDVIITPHAAGVSLDIPVRTARMMAHRLNDWLEGS